ncbi:rhodanese-like domain-containing protein [Chryseobacterium sp. SNU WT5]|uniref:rhodanese-like domain-containing protein n=1 Tax=Chryseobacterium sp. SNU WT5 TaxID=2594269 RepID=UPI0011805198|nr:rhodanese-like domain-containing protein [Chryseobacterium sp. SNU WT5]QDP85111.1 rhodanese-like domain-containing protein [Chryseobacterium sp. SNU WT5]
MRFKNFIITLLLFVAFSSCKTTDVNAVASRSDIKEIVNDPQTTLIDVRIADQFSDKTASGAINIPLALIEDNLDFLKKQKQIVIFCNTGRQADQAIEILRKNGIKNAYSAKSLQNVQAIRNETR